MRCKKHLTDLSSSVGVCASCLSERLLALIAAQAQAHAQAKAQARAQKLNHDHQEDRRKTDSHRPPPLLFPRSVSPYISHRKSDHAAASDQSHHHHHHTVTDQVFYSTPQVGPTGGANFADNSYKKQKSRFSFISRLFRSKSASSSSSSPSWLNGGHQKRQAKLFSVNESAVRNHRKTERRRDRGMSPARVSDYGGGGGEEECCGGGSSGYSSESSQGWKQTPQRAVVPVRRGGGGRTGHSRNVSGLTFCLSPLVRASPNRHWTQKGMQPPETAFSGGDARVPAYPHLATAAALCANRSRKLTDFGRRNH